MTGTAESEETLKILEGKVEALEWVLRCLLQIPPWSEEVSENLMQALLTASKDISEESPPNQVDKVVAAARLLSFVQHLMKEEDYKALIENEGESI